MNARAAELTDAAWVVIETPLAPQALAAFCADLERLFRINPLLEFQTWRWVDSESIRLSLKNLSNGHAIDVGATVDRTDPRAITVRYARGLKRSTRFEIEPAPCGSRLRIVDDYSGIEPDEARARADEVDRSLTAWGAALHTYLERERRWGRSAAWCWYMRRVWLPMKPVGRRVTYILFVVTAVEIVAIGLAAAIYALNRA
jgi:hypothetical protein